MHSTVDLLGHEDNDSNALQDLRRHSEVHGCQALDQEQHMQFYIQNSTVKSTVLMLTSNLRKVNTLFV